MAYPTNFDESNNALSPPKGVSEDEVQSLSTWQGKYPDSEQEVVISCWKFSKEELEEINRTGRVWLHIWGPTMPPAFLSGICPFQR